VDARGDAALQELLAPTDVLVISDEVYEHMVFDGRPRKRRPLPRPGRALASSSQLRQDLPRDRLEGRHVAAPAALTAEFRKVHQFNVFTVNTPMQHGWPATWPTRRPTWSCPPSTNASATCSAAGLATRFKLLPSEGTYFQCVDISAVSDLRRSRFLPVADP
jgi:methionine aminotransferase